MEKSQEGQPSDKTIVTVCSQLNAESAGDSLLAKLAWEPYDQAWLLVRIAATWVEFGEDAGLECFEDMVGDDDRAMEQVRLLAEAVLEANA